MLTRKEIQAIAGATVMDHGLPLVAELKRHDNYSGSNLIALMELFAGRLLAANDGDGVVGTIDSKLGSGWTRNLAEALIDVSAGTPPKATRECRHFWSDPSKGAATVECLYCGVKKVADNAPEGHKQ